jgi:putative transposase
MLHNQHWKKKMLWQKNFWSRWYFVTTAWIDLEIVKKYIQNQNKKDKVEDWEQLDFNW